MLHAFGSDVLAVVTAAPPPASVLSRWRGYRRRYSWSQLWSRVWARTYRRIHGLDARRQASLQRMLFPAGDWEQTPPPDRLRTVPSHNGPEALALLETLRPDVIAVYGTGIIRAGVMAMAPTVLNMHTGISPRYRGADTVFWPLHNREPQWIGTTIHQLDAGIDAGPVLATVRPSIESTDDEDSLFAKCVVAGAAAYVAAVRDAHGGSARPSPQDPSAAGREYRFADRTVSAERRVRRLLEEGLLREFADEHR